MTTRNFEDKFLAYLDGSLGEEARAELEAELKSDPALRAAFEEYRQIFGGMRKLGSRSYAAGPAFASEVLSQIETVKVTAVNKRLYMKKFLKVLLGVVLVVGVLFLVGPQGMSGGAALLAFCLVAGAVLTSLVKRFEFAAGLTAAALALFVVNSMFLSGREVKRSFRRIGSAIVGGNSDPALAYTADPSRNGPGGGPEVGTRNLMITQRNQSESLNSKVASDARGTFERRTSDIFNRTLERIAETEETVAGALSNSKPGHESENIRANNFDLRHYDTNSVVSGIEISNQEGLADKSHLSPLGLLTQSNYPEPRPQNLGQETYGQYAENPRLDVASSPLSTFSIDVDTASYSNMRRFLRNGQLPPPDSVRIEEYLNYFDYNYEAEGNKPFSVHYEVAPSPLDPGRFLLKVGVRAKRTEAEDPAGWNLVFLVDVSGSMADPNKLPLVKEALKFLADRMRPVDRLAIVTYADGAGIRLPSTSGAERDRIRSAIDGLSAGGSTYASAGIDLAYNVALGSRIPGSVNRVILATDGDFNVGTYSFEGLMNLVEAKRRSGISLTTLGFGEANLKDLNLEQLADRGNGNYFYIDSFREARKIFEKDLVGNMETIAKDVKLQIEFNPGRVAEYRLIGYDNRKLENKDFNNDAVDAGEIGAGHTVTALYELTLAGSPLASGKRYERRYTEGEKGAVEDKKEIPHGTELAFLKIRYKEPEGSSSALLEFPILASAMKQSGSETSSDFRFAAAVAYFGQLLRQSAYAQGYGADQVAALARTALGEDPNGARREFVGLVDDSKALLSNSAGR